MVCRFGRKLHHGDQEGLLNAVPCPIRFQRISRRNSFLYCRMSLSGHSDWKYAIIDLISSSVRRSPKDGMEDDPSGDPPLSDAEQH